MANNKVQLANGLVLIDLTEDTVTPEVLGSGYTAHDARGQQITGTMVSLTIDSLSASSNGTYTPASNHAYGEVVVNVETDDHYLQELLARSVSSSYYNPVLTNAGPYAFTGCSNITSVDLPACSYIGASAFHSCNKLTTVIASACTSIGYRAFYGPSLISSLSFPECLYIGSDAFYWCRNLSNVDFPKCEVISNSAFYNCTNLESVSFPNCKTIGKYAFGNCSSYRFKSAYFPKCESVYGRAFDLCTSLYDVSLPNCVSLSSNVFTGCTSLQELSLPKLQCVVSYAFEMCSHLSRVVLVDCFSILSSAFISCYRLVSLYLLGSSKVDLTDGTAFTSTPIVGFSTYTSEVGSIYVRSSLMSIYLSSLYNPWSYFSRRFVGLTDEEADDILENGLPEQT